MELVKSTTRVLAFKALNRYFDKVWVDWAVEMLMAGFENDNLMILAGEFEPYNQFQLQDLTTKVFKELNLDFSDKDLLIKNYACYLIDKFFIGELDNFKVLFELKDICIELDHEKYLYGFYSLYFAKEDLFDSENQWYWEGATRENIEKIIEEYFLNWKSNCKEKTTNA